MSNSDYPPGSAEVQSIVEELPISEDEKIAAAFRRRFPNGSDWLTAYSAFRAGWLARGASE